MEARSDPSPRDEVGAQARGLRLFVPRFHANPDYALWYGWSEMLRDLTEIKEKAAELRAKKKE